MMRYTQLTREQRYQIQALMKAGKNQTEIAEIVGVHYPGTLTLANRLARRCARSVSALSTSGLQIRFSDRKAVCHSFWFSLRTGTV